MYSSKINAGISIREAESGDAMVIWQAISTHREYLKKWLPFVERIKQVEDEEAFLTTVLAVPYEERNIVFVIENEKKFCGLVGFVNTDVTNHRTEIGYWLLPEFQGRGIMTQCVSHLCQWAIRERGINRIQIRCATGNKSSNAIPQRLNFKLEGTEREGELLASGVYADIHVYSILKSEIS